MKRSAFRTTVTLLIATLIFLLLSLLVAAQSTGWQDPSLDFGYFDNPRNAYHDNNKKAKARDGEAHTYWLYNLDVPTAATIVGIEVRLDVKPKNTPVNAVLEVQLTWNAGWSWTTAYSVGIPEAGGKTTYVLGGPGGLWGHTWLPSQFGNWTFAVRILARTDGGSLLLYWAPVRVYYAEFKQELLLSPESVSFDQITEADYDAGYKQVDQTLTITSSTSWTIVLEGLSEMWTYTGPDPDPSKPVSELLWKSASGDAEVTYVNPSYTGVTTSGAQVAAGNAGVGIPVTVSLRMILSYENDPSGEYGLNYIYTLASP